VRTAGEVIKAKAEVGLGAQRIYRDVSTPTLLATSPRLSSARLPVRVRTRKPVLTESSGGRFGIERGTDRVSRASRYAVSAVLKNDPADRCVINFRAGYAEEATAMIDALIDVAGLRPEEIAFFTQRDEYDDVGFGVGLVALQRHGLKDSKTVLHVGYVGNTLAVESAVADLLEAKKPPRAVVMIGAYAPCAKFIRLCRALDLNPLFLNVSFVGGNSFADALGKTDAQIIVTQVVPFPSDESVPIVREYQVDLKAFDPPASAGFCDFEGYIDARILTLALETLKGSPTREAVVDALEGLGQFDIGLGEPLYLSRSEHQASRRVWPTILKGGRFVPFHWSDITALLKEGAPP
jgi:branched-chain amino acid transport system substrate-binding protein